MAIPFSFLVSWAKAHKSENSSLTYVRTLEQKNLFQTIEEIVSSNDSGKKISDLRAFITARFNDIQKDYQNANGLPVVLGDVPDTEAFVDRLKAFLQDYLDIFLKTAPALTKSVFGESFVSRPFHAEVPNDENLGLQFSVTGQTIRDHRKRCINDCRILLMDGNVVNSYVAKPSLVRELNLIRDQFGAGISYETACRLTGINDARTFYFLLRLFDMDITQQDSVRIPAVLPNRTISPYTDKLGRVLDFFREETVFLRYNEDIVPALKRITKDENLLESFKSIISRSDEFLHYQVNDQEYIALRWDLLYFLAPRVCWILFQEKAFDLKSAISCDKLVTLYNSRDYAGKYKAPRITVDVFRATQLAACWRLMGIGRTEYWMIRSSKNEQFDLKTYVKGIVTPEMTELQFTQAAKNCGLIPIYSERTLIPIYEELRGKKGRSKSPSFNWDALLDEMESLLRTKNSPMKANDLADALYQIHQLTSPFKAFATNVLQHIKSTSKFITQNGASPKDGVWVALPGMTFPKSYREEIREKAVGLLLKAENYTMDQKDLNKIFGPMVPNNLVKTSALQSIFSDTTYFLRNGKGGKGGHVTITLNPLLQP